MRLRAKVGTIKWILLLYYLAISLTVLSFIYFIPKDMSMDHTIQMILCIYLLLFPIVLFYTLRYALHLFLFLLAFIAGFYGFYHYSIDDHSISNALYFTFRLYLLDLADVFTQDGSSPVRYPLLLEIARWAAASYTISTIFIAIYRTLEKKIALFFVQSIGNHHVIFGYNEKSQHLIHDLRGRNERVVVVDEQFLPETQNMLETMKVLVIQAPLNDEHIFKVCGITKAKSVSIFYENDQNNLYILLKLEQFFQDLTVQRIFKKLIIHIEEHHYKAELISFLKTVNLIPAPTKVINVYEEVAKRFWKKHQAVFQHGNDVHLLVVGHDSFGKQIISEAEKSFQKNKKDGQFTITILDEFMEREVCGNIEKIPFNIEKDSLESAIANHHYKFTQIFICLDEDYMDLMEGVELSEIFPDMPIYMHFTDESIHQTFRIATTKTKKSLYSTGTIKDVLTKEYLKL